MLIMAFLMSKGKGQKMEKKKAKASGLFFVFIVAALTLLLGAVVVSSAPDGVTITILGNTTKTSSGGGMANYTGNSTSLPNVAGGFIFTMNITGKTQNTRWKAFVGNATGKLTLEDSNAAVIYDWTLTTISGEVYATRSSGTINWTGIGCANLNITEEENRLLNHSSKDDNITATFSASNNDLITVGTKTLAPNSCRTLNIYANSTTNQVDTFEEMVLYDRNSTPFNFGVDGAVGNVIYTQQLESDALGYNNASTYDFQMLVPERGETGWTSTTPYYFYIELS